MYTAAVSTFGPDAVGLSAYYGARSALFPHVALAEHGGWEGTRWALTSTLRVRGYNWSDLEFDYPATLATADWGNPHART